ncbi:unnamed protein product [Discosporangium mesarthrocarpum]
MNYRNRVETDLDEVLQIESVFQNVSKKGGLYRVQVRVAEGTTPC